MISVLEVCFSVVQGGIYGYISKYPGSLKLNHRTPKLAIARREGKDLPKFV